MSGRVVEGAPTVNQNWIGGTQVRPMVIAWQRERCAVRIIARGGGRGGSEEGEVERGWDSHGEMRRRREQAEPTWEDAVASGKSWRSLRGEMRRPPSRATVGEEATTRAWRGEARSDDGEMGRGTTTTQETHGSQVTLPICGSRVRSLPKWTSGLVLVAI